MPLLESTNECYIAVHSRLFFKKPTIDEKGANLKVLKTYKIKYNMTFPSKLCTVDI